MPDDFFERTELLADMVGDGDLDGEFRVEREYAVNQHEQGWRNYLGAYGPKKIKVYHRGGGPKFVEDPLKENFPRYYQDMADSVLTGKLPDAMEDALKDLDDELQTRAPERSGALKKAGSYTVTDDGRVLSYKPPGVPYRDPNPGNPPGPIINLLKQAGKL